MTRPRVYIETTIVSYLAATPSRDIVLAAHQQLTQEWWDRRGRFELYVSGPVMLEVMQGAPDAAARRATLLQGVPLLSVTAEASALASRLVDTGVVPPKAAMDALHIAIAAASGMDYLLTWNCAHIANAAIRGRIERSCLLAGLEAPVICTPEELSEI